MSQQGKRLSRASVSAEEREALPVFDCVSTSAVLPFELAGRICDLRSLRELTSDLIGHLTELPELST